MPVCWRAVIDKRKRMSDLDSNENIAHRIDNLEQRIKLLRIRFEQYFAGVEKRAPLRERDAIKREILQLNQRKIMQTALRHKFQNLSSNFHIYMGMWERIQREMDEGRYHRHRQKTPAADSQKQEQTEIERIYQGYQEIAAAGNGVTLPSRQQLEAFIQQQRKKIQSKYGNVQCSFSVSCENGKPKLKVNLKR
jgi:hypothetical protein